jgi:hypothetical protein
MTRKESPFSSLEIWRAFGRRYILAAVLSRWLAHRPRRYGTPAILAGLVAILGVFGATAGPRLTRALMPRDTGPNTSSIGYIDRPKPRTSVSSVFAVEGWAADVDGVVEVRIYVDNDRAAVVRPSVARPDVDALFPQVARERHGFGAELNVGSKTGPAFIRAEVLDTRGAVTTVARARIAIDP